MTLAIKPGGGFLGCSHPERRRVQHKLAASLAQPKAAAGTIFFPDVSGYQSGLTIQAGTAAVLAKATEGSSYIDPSYRGFQAQATAKKSVFGAYHFQWDAGMAEARHVYQVVGRTPLMLDVENTNQRVTLAMVMQLVTNYRSLGGVVHLAYIPRWYWEGTMGSPSLLPLQKLGVYVVSSNYTGYSDSGPGWAPIGGALPVQWQYTDAFPYGEAGDEQPIDFNAFKGTVADYRAVLTGAAPTPTPATTTPEDDMITYIQEARLVGDPGGKKHGCYAPIWKAENGFLDWLDEADFVNNQWWASHQWKNAFAAGAVQVVAPGTLGAFGALRPGTAVPPPGQWSGAPLRGYTPPAANQVPAAAVDEPGA